MKTQGKKAYINITELVKGVDKENRCANTRPTSRNSRRDAKEEKKGLGKEVFQRTLNVERQGLRLADLDLGDSCRLKNRTDYLQSKRKTHAHFSIQDLDDEKLTILKNQPQKSQLIETLINSQKMFIDPQKWQSFLRRSQSDQKFHRALSAFLYSYFITNYH